MEKITKKLSTESYKGVRDMYPTDMFVQNYIFDTWKKAVEGFGYEEYGASVLEPTELYRAKSGEEIINEQTYNFRDRGDREVTLRPEMTPTVARMVAARRRELAFPLRWYSIPNLFRYEQPQRGRLREHWQLNVDLFGVDSLEAEIEIIQLAAETMHSFGAKRNEYEIRINSRKIIDQIFATFSLDADKSHRLAKLIDKKEKMDSKSFENLTAQILQEQNIQFQAMILSKTPEDLEKLLPAGSAAISELKDVLSKLRNMGCDNVLFSPTLMRGFDYYTGIVFEIFDTDSTNRRSLFGGGRYDDLTSLFGGDAVPAVGFGMGDVTIRDFLETHHLMPAYRPASKIYLCPLEEKFFAEANKLATELRSMKLNVAVDYSGRKVSDQIRAAGKLDIPFIIAIGDDEIKSGIYKVKNLTTGVETPLKVGEVAELLLQSK
jgi:histidyl-tRNA synthetase